MYTYHRKSLVAIVLVAMMSLLLGQLAYAQEVPVEVVTAVPLADSPPGVVELSFAQLGESTMALHGPVDSTEMSFSLPYRWQMQAGGYIQLYFDLLFDTAGDVALADNPPTFLVEVYFDDTPITAVNLVEIGAGQALQVPVPATAVGDSSSNRHTIRLVLTTGRDCEDDGRTSLVIHDYSFVHIAYEEAEPELNLIDFPRPLVQELLVAENISLVVPNSYSDADLSAAAALAALLGERSDNNVVLDLVPASEATADRLGTNHIIVLGTPGNNQFLQDLYAQGVLPTQLDGGGAIVASDKQIFSDDGVVQLATTEAGTVLLVVTGSTDEAVARAVQALTVRQTDPRFGFEGVLAVVEAVNDVEEAAASDGVEVYTLTDLDFRDTTLYGVGRQSRTVSFFVPSSWRMTEDPLLLLTYIPSAALQPEASALTVLLNNRPVGSTILDGSAEGERELLLRLPADEIALGDTNRLRFEVTMDVAQPCVEPDLGLAWTRIKENGRLQISYTEATDRDAPLAITDPLTSLVSRHDLRDVWFALPTTPTVDELNGMLDVAGTLGDISRGYGFKPQVSLNGLPTDELLPDYHLVGFGEPERSSLVTVVNDDLPQPFLEGSNSLRQQLGNVVFRFPEDFSLGVVETIHSPWSPHRVVTVVSGTSKEGVDWSLKALANDELLSQMDGNISFVRADRVEALNLLGQATDREQLLRLPETVNRLTQPEVAANDGGEATTSEAAAEVVAPEPLPTAVPTTDFPEPGPLPEQYQPAAPRLGSMSGLAFGLIGAGVLVALLGLFLTARRSRQA